MSLSLYNKKRDFSQTPEPSGKQKAAGKALRFVVQKHDASSLHYDFRLQMEGVLKSWAVPKGPSLNPADKRLAMFVEDHPFDYRTFEGTIPEGNYGAGTVIVWDEGTYELYDGEGLSVKEQEKKLLQDLASGSLKIVLHGQKLNGAFALFQLKRDKEGKQWLLVKKSDEAASEEDITVQDASVLSGKTIAQVAAENGMEINNPEALKTAAKAKSKTTNSKAVAAKKAATKRDSRGLAAGGKKASAPTGIKPMLATLVDQPFDSKDWIFEIKWDGYRALSYCNNKKVDLVSRNRKPFKDKYGPVKEALQNLGINAVLDGEIVAVDENGLANFQLLQNWQNNAASLQYFVFDILWLDGKDLTQLPLVERKRILRRLLPEDNDMVRYSDEVDEKGKAFFDAAMKQGLEGVMAKRKDSPYVVDSRTDSWVKIKSVRRQEVIICGYTEPRNTRQYFGALLLGVYQGKELIYIGHTGGGFNKQSLKSIYEQLQPLAIKECPFKKCPKGNMPVTWVKPQLVCEIKFTEWTKDLIARHPIFMGLRQDKKAKEITIENSTAMAAIVHKKVKAPAKKGASKTTAKAASKSPAKTKAAKKSKGKKDVSTSGTELDIGAGKEQIVTLDGHELKFTSLDKWYWKKEKITKGETLNYYLKIAPYILPYLLDRPHSLNRHPNGVGAPNFYQKNVEGKVPDWIQKHEDFSESTDVNVQYLVCDGEASLMYMANLGCIEINPWHARVTNVSNPDWCLIDLDPDTKNTYDQVVETAMVIKDILDSIGAESYPKTSGSTGMHIYIPLGAKYSFEQSKQLAELVVTMAQKELPKITSMERTPAKRKGKIYLDFLQNRETQTAAAPYSLRPKPGVPVSTPLD
ncbi:MAG: DNA ligase D, partial [Chitinophagaceae bacterium]